MVAFSAFPPSRRTGAASRALRVGVSAALGLCLLSALGCRRTRGETMPTYLGDERSTSVDASALDPGLADAWRRLQTTWADAPESEAVADIADEILAADPPLGLALEALRAKSANAYLGGRDTVAAGFASDALDRGAGSGMDPEIERELLELRLRALARGGDPQVAVAELSDAVRVARSGLPVVELAGLRAVAYERDAQYEVALANYALWREGVADDTAAAAFAEARLATLGASLPVQSITETAATLAPSAAKRCVEALGHTLTPAAEDLAWVRACAPVHARVGLLLPRTGPLSALADPQLAAASAAAVSLRGANDDAVLWEDAGSSPASAAAGARTLLAQGVGTIVGPVGASNVRAVQDAVGGMARVIVPGESVGAAEGVAPSLETRVAALVGLAKDRGGRQFMVLAPDNGYGRRALAAIRAPLSAPERKALVVQTYPPDTTSFAPLLMPLAGGLRPGGVLLVPDHTSRLASVVRQILRLGKAPAVTSKEGVMVLSTAEGASQSVLEAEQKVLRNVWLAPAAFASQGSAEFEQAFRDAEGEMPDDQALLVYEALRRAISGAPSREGAVTPVLVHMGEDGHVRRSTN